MSVATRMVTRAAHGPVKAKHPRAPLSPDQSKSIQLCEYWSWQPSPTSWVSNLAVCIPLYFSALSRAKKHVWNAWPFLLQCDEQVRVEGFVDVRWKRCSHECALLCRHFCSMWSKGSLKVVWQDLHTLPNTSGLLNKNKGPEVGNTCACDGNKLPDAGATQPSLADHSLHGDLSSFCWS